MVVGQCAGAKQKRKFFQPISFETKAIFFIQPIGSPTVSRLQQKTYKVFSVHLVIPIWNHAASGDLSGN
jgi:hypothetical protein